MLCLTENSLAFKHRKAHVNELKDRYYKLNSVYILALQVLPLQELLGVSKTNVTPN